MEKHPLSGSERTELAGSKILGQYDLNEKIEVRLTLRRQHQTEMQLGIKKLEAGEDTPPLDRKTFASLYSTSPDDLAKVRAFASENGLTIVRENAAASAVTLSGTVAQFQNIFEVKLQRYEHPKRGQYRGRTSAIHIPDKLRDVVTAVLGLDNRPQVRHHFRARPQAQSTSPAAPPPASPTAPAKEQPLSFTPPEIASLYNFPAGDGKGQCIGIIELGGGYKESDLTSFFSAIGVAMPTIVPVGIGGASNQPAANPDGTDGEATLDIEICGALAPGAKLAVYFVKNQEDALLVEAIDYAIHDDINQPSILSISFGDSESGWTEQARQSLNSSFQIAALLGITVCVASGDSGSSNGTKDNADDVIFPASSPYVLACGGTRLIGSEQSIDSEVVWNDGPDGGASGGGVSKFFPVPPWQKGLSTTRTTGPAKVLTNRGVPDVAGDASGNSGYKIFFGGRAGVASGTSAVAPLWAALVARINSAKNKTVGFINPKLYRNPNLCHDVTQGNNGSYAAAPGWDACTGLGSPNGQKIFELL
jgi:kumamolisin